MQELAKILEVIISLSLTLFASWILLKPMLAEEQAIDNSDEDMRALLLTKEIAVSSLEELEQDYLAGKVDRNAYERMKLELSEQVIGVMKQIDNSQAPISPLK